MRRRVTPTSCGSRCQLGGGPAADAAALFADGGRVAGRHRRWLPGAAGVTPGPAFTPDLGQTSRHGPRRRPAGTGDGCRPGPATSDPRLTGRHWQQQHWCSYAVMGGRTSSPRPAESEGRPVHRDAWETIQTPRRTPCKHNSVRQLYI